MLIINGLHGEGGGQILRTSLALALVTGKAFRIENIRANRKTPGLLRQHLTAVNAAAEVGQAEVSGAMLGSGELTFVPGEVVAGDYRFAVGSAGSAMLVLQTVLLPLALADNPSTLVLEGGTHNRCAPQFDFIEESFLPLINRMGVRATAELERYGFYPAGGGCVRVGIEPVRKLNPLELIQRGEIVGQRARAVVANIDLRIAEREIAVIKKKLGWRDECLRVEQVRNSPGPGNYVAIAIESEQVTEVVTGFGERGVPAEVVAENAVKEARRYMACDAAVGEHLADQLLLPMALAGGGRFTTLEPLSSHTTTNIETIKRFLDVEITSTSLARGVCRIDVHTR